MVSLGWLQQGPRVESSSHSKPACPWLLCGSPGPKLLGGSASGLQSKTEFWALQVSHPWAELDSWQSQIFAFQALHWFFSWAFRGVSLHLWKFQHYKNRSKHRSYICVFPTCTQLSKEPVLIAPGDSSVTRCHVLWLVCRSEAFRHWEALG